MGNGALLAALLLLNIINTRTRIVLCRIFDDLGWPRKLIYWHVGLTGLLWRRRNRRLS